MGTSLPRMGNSCTPCSERPQRSDRVALVGFPAKESKHGASSSTAGTPQLVSVRRGEVSRKESQMSRQGSVNKADTEKTEHEGQIRATLHVKDGGFALRNFERRNPGKVEDFFRFETKLGEGGFGTVRRGQDKRTERWCAVKCVRKKGGKDDQRLHEEIEIMRLLDHPHIVRLVESFEDHKYTHLILELCEGGELLEQIIQAKFFTENTAAKYIKQMLLALNYLHQNHIMHRDLKPENWLLATKEGLGKAPLKLIDFGISRRFKPGVPARTKAGTPNYVAPEVLQGRYDEKSDIWSLGVISYVLLTGTHPFPGKTTKEILQKVKQAHVRTEGGNWNKVSDAAKSFVRTSLSKTPGSRHSALKALEDRWLAFSSKEEAGALANLELTGLQAFGRMHQLKKAACTVIATQLTDERIEALRAQFMAMDDNKDGTLSVAELKAGFQSAGVSCPSNLDRLLQEADTDGSGVVDYTEFLAATMDKKTYHQESTVWMAFKKFDLNGSGSIDRHELSKVLSDDSVKKAMHLQDEAHSSQLEEIFNAVDTNNDGEIDFEEFFAMMCKAEGGKTGESRSRSARRKATADRGQVGRGDLGIACAEGKKDKDATSPRGADQRGSSPSRGTSQRTSPRRSSEKASSPRRGTSQRGTSPSRGTSQRGTSPSRGTSQRGTSPSRGTSQRKSRSPRGGGGSPRRRGSSTSQNGQTQHSSSDGGAGYRARSNSTSSLMKGTRSAPVATIAEGDER